MSHTPLPTTAASRASKRAECQPTSHSIPHPPPHHCSIKSKHEGLDFYFSNRSHAVKLIDFLQNVVPVRFRHDKQLVSHNIHESTYNYKARMGGAIVICCC